MSYEREAADENEALRKSVRRGGTSEEGVIPARIWLFADSLWGGAVL